MPVCTYLKFTQVPFDLRLNLIHADYDQIPYTESGVCLAYNNKKSGRLLNGIMHIHLSGMWIGSCIQTQHMVPQLGLTYRKTIGVDLLNSMEPGSTMDKPSYPSPLGSFGRGSGSFCKFIGPSKHNQGIICSIFGLEKSRGFPYRLDHLEVA